MISVVMATYNGEKFIEEQLLSILKQTRQPDEVIISDDGSSDDTVEIITAFIKKYNLNTWQLYINPFDLKKHPEYIKASLNFINAVKKTSGDIIFFSDQDDIWDFRKIEIMTNLIEKHPQIYALCCNKTYIDKNGNLLKSEVVNGYKKHSLSKVTMISFPIKQSIASGMCMAIRRCVFTHMLKINSSHYYYYDYYFGIIASALEGLYFYNEVLASHRRHTDSLTVGLGIKRDWSKRLSRHESRMNCLLLILDVITYFSKEPLFLKEIYCYKMCLKIYHSRIINCQNQKIIATLLMLRYVPKYITLKSYIGDIIYVLKLEKYFR